MRAVLIIEVNYDDTHNTDQDSIRHILEGVANYLGNDDLYADHAQDIVVEDWDYDVIL